MSLIFRHQKEVAAWAGIHITHIPAPAIPLILEKIAKCESGGKQFNADGSVVRHYNKNGTIDYGYMQINSIHILEAEKLGIDIMTQKGNLRMALILFRRHGAKIWFGYNVEIDDCSWKKGYGI